MNIVRACVRNPVTTLVGVILAVLFGAISLFRIPVQMIPTVDRAGDPTSGSSSRLKL